ncbi:PadR family transcriptional regulator [Amycolatopsis nigrescens]|uniref:PadR family transcriptional regulator n=1 Tax=Amycolatopsis nigrescens TaxID=381445 RepID=UPI00036EC891|nr:PadR family transcriptional regulator [Amycolatopsis nigrescens]
MAGQPPTPAVFHLLLALTGGPRHGYALGQEVERLSGGRMRLGAGTLYRSLQRMRVDGLLAEEGSDTEDERRRVYSLTAAGRRAAAEEAERLRELVRFAVQKGLLSPELES